MEKLKYNVVKLVPHGNSARYVYRTNEGCYSSYAQAIEYIEMMGGNKVGATWYIKGIEVVIEVFEITRNNF